MSKCNWILYGDEYYETDCSQQLDLEEVTRIDPTHCPYCGNEIKFEEPWMIK